MIKRIAILIIVFCQFAAIGQNKPAMYPNTPLRLGGDTIGDVLFSVVKRDLGLEIANTLIPYGTGTGITSKAEFNINGDNLNHGGTFATMRVNSSSEYAKYAFNHSGLSNDANYFQTYLSGTALQYNTQTGWFHQFLVNNVQQARIGTFGVHSTDANGFGFLGYTTSKIWHDANGIKFNVSGNNRMTLTPQGRLTNIGNPSYGSIYLNGGLETATGSYNFVAGTLAGSALTTGAINVFIAAQAGQNTTTGSNNAFIGFSAGYNNINGNNNVAVAPYALYYNTSGLSNVALGDYSLYFNNDADYNVGIGNSAGSSNITGNGNTSIGIQANGLQIVGNTYTITAIDNATQRITVTGANISALVGKRVQFKTDANAVSGWTYPTNNYWIDVVVISSVSTTTVLELKTGTFSGSTVTGTPTLSIRFGYSLFNSTAIGQGANNDANNQASFGNSNLNEVTFKNHIYRWDLSASSLTMSDNGKFWAYNSTSGKTQLTDNIPTIKLSNGTANTFPIFGTSGVINNSLLTFNGTDKLLFNTSANTPQFSLKSSGVYASVDFDVSSTTQQYRLLAYDAADEGMRHYVPSSRSHKFLVNNAEVSRFSSAGLTMNNLKITGLATPTASTDATSKSFTDNTYLKKPTYTTANFPTNGSYSITLGSQSETYRLNAATITGTTMTLTITTTNATVGNSYIFMVYGWNQNTIGFNVPSNWKYPDGNQFLGSPNSSTNAWFSATAIWDGTNFIISSYYSN